MGRHSEMVIWEMERIYSNVPEKRLCSSHIDDYAIKKFIKENQDMGYCDYCDSEKLVIDLTRLMDFMQKGILNFYDDAAEFMSYDGKNGGYLGITYTPNELIQEIIELKTDPFEVTEDIVGSLDNIAWANPYEYYDSESDIYNTVWENFKNTIKHKSRYLFSDTKDEADNDQSLFDVLKKVGNYIDNEGLYIKINNKNPLYRCHQHEKRNEINSLRRAVAPPLEHAVYSNRFSPAGISMLYASFDYDTAIRETIDLDFTQKSFYTVVELGLKDTITLIDLSDLPRIPSIFDLGRFDVYYIIKFLHGFVRDMTKEIQRDGKEHIEYIPTQVVTEFFRYTFNEAVDQQVKGIIYPSSKNNGYTSMVIFWDNEKCVEKLTMNSTTTDLVKELKA